MQNSAFVYEIPPKSTILAEIGGSLQNSAQFVGISAKILRNVASIFVSTGRCFDWWRPAPKTQIPLPADLATFALKTSMFAVFGRRLVRSKYFDHLITALIIAYVAFIGL